jgi:hypothetical protein
MTANGVSNFDAMNEEVCTGHDEEELEHGDEHPCASQEINETMTATASRSNKMAVLFSVILCSIGFIVASNDRPSALLPRRESPQRLQRNSLRPLDDNLDDTPQAKIAINANMQRKEGECAFSSFINHGMFC